ncbi:MAG TPA: STAS domain-containing protein [Acidimicrobiales bacterium]|nr:STAS domain-containing protein [Acidimicrobiales bacterium]
MLTFDQDTGPDDCVVCRPVGELDACTVGEFRRTVGRFASHPKVLIDLSDVPLVDSAGLGGIIGGIHDVRDHGGRVAVVSRRPSITKLLRFAGFERIVPVVGSLDEGSAALHPAGRSLSRPAL